MTSKTTTARGQYWYWSLALAAALWLALASQAAPTVSETSETPAIDLLAGPKDGHAG